MPNILFLCYGTMTTLRNYVWCRMERDISFLNVGECFYITGQYLLNHTEKPYGVGIGDL